MAVPSSPPSHATGAPRLPAVVGHRGAAGDAPENTLAGLRAAAELGATWVEVDVRLARDGVPVLIHDRDLSRTTDGSGPVSARTAGELDRTDAGRRFGPRFAGEPVPRLGAALDVLRRLGLGAVLEIKADDAATGRATLAACLDAVAARRARGDGPELLVSCADPSVVAEAARRAPHQPRALVIDAPPRGGFAALAGLGCHSFHARHDWIDAGVVAAAAPVAPLVAYTVNDAARATALWALGVVAVISDVPGLILPAAGAAGRRAAPAPRRTPPRPPAR